MPDFSLSSTWHIPSPPEQVWPCLIHPETWPGWWKYVESVETMPSGLSTIPDNKRRFYWQTRLPYRLVIELTVTRAIPHKFIAVTVQGDLVGTGRCRLSADAESTRLEFNWQVTTCKPWMNRFAFLCRPVFEWNHAQVMKEGEKGLAGYISALKNSAIT